MEKGKVKSVDNLFRCYFDVVLFTLITSASLAISHSSQTEEGIQCLRCTENTSLACEKRGELELCKSNELCMKTFSYQYFSTQGEQKNDSSSVFFNQTGYVFKSYCASREICSDLDSVLGFKDLTTSSSNPRKEKCVSVEERNISCWHCCEDSNCGKNFAFQEFIKNYKMVLEFTSSDAESFFKNCMMYHDCQYDDWKKQIVDSLMSITNISIPGSVYTFVHRLNPLNITTMTDNNTLEDNSNQLNQAQLINVIIIIDIEAIQYNNHNTDLIGIIAQRFSKSTLLTSPSFKKLVNSNHPIVLNHSSVKQCPKERSIVVHANKTHPSFDLVTWPEIYLTGTHVKVICTNYTSNQTDNPFMLKYYSRKCNENGTWSKQIEDYGCLQEHNGNFPAIIEFTNISFNSMDIQHSADANNESVIPSIIAFTNISMDMQHLVDAINETFIQSLLSTLSTVSSPSSYSLSGHDNSTHSDQKYNQLMTRVNRYKRKAVVLESLTNIVNQLLLETQTHLKSSTRITFSKLSQMIERLYGGVMREKIFPGLLIKRTLTVFDNILKLLTTNNYSHRQELTTHLRELVNKVANLGDPYRTSHTVFNTFKRVTSNVIKKGVIILGRLNSKDEIDIEARFEPSVRHADVMIIIPNGTLVDSSDDEILLTVEAHRNNILYPSYIYNVLSWVTRVHFHGPQPELKNNVTVIFSTEGRGSGHEKISFIQCVHWKKSKSRWEDSKCHMVSTNERFTTCSCSVISTYGLSSRLGWPEYEKSPVTYGLMFLLFLSLTTALMMFDVVILLIPEVQENGCDTTCFIVVNMCSAIFFLNGIFFLRLTRYAFGNERDCLVRFEPWLGFSIIASVVWIYMYLYYYLLKPLRQSPGLTWILKILGPCFGWLFPALLILAIEIVDRLYGNSNEERFSTATVALSLFPVIKDVQGSEAILCWRNPYWFLIPGTVFITVTAAFSLLSLMCLCQTCKAKRFMHSIILITLLIICFTTAFLKTPYLFAVLNFLLGIYLLCVEIYKYRYLVIQTPTEEPTEPT